MLRLCCCTGFVFILWAASSLHAQNQAPKPFQVGETFYQVVTISTRQTMVVQGQKVPQTQVVTYTVSWTPAKHEAAKWHVNYKILDITLDLTLGDNQINAKGGGPNSVITPTLQALKNTELTLIIGDRLELLKIEGLKRLPPINNGQLDPLVKTLFGEDALRQVANPLHVALPGDLVAGRNKLNKESVLRLGQLGNLNLESTFAQKAATLNVALIVVETKGTHEPLVPKAAGGGPVPKKSDFKLAKTSGELRFDRKVNRVESADETLEIAGRATIIIGGQDVEIELTQIFETKSRTTNTRPQ